jgi:Asp-tRNA(Asn)/Glu-tRNA(Gln) amidotransferase C subunit
MPATDVDTLRRAARLAGFEFSDAALASLRSAIERSLDALRRLDELPLGSVEPVTQYRVV